MPVCKGLERLLNFNYHHKLQLQLPTSISFSRVLTDLCQVVLVEGIITRGDDDEVWLEEVKEGQGLVAVQRQVATHVYTCKGTYRAEREREST